MSSSPSLCGKDEGLLPIVSRRNVYWPRCWARRGTANCERGAAAWRSASIRSAQLSQSRGCRNQCHTCMFCALEITRGSGMLRDAQVRRRRSAASRSAPSVRLPGRMIGTLRRPLPSQRRPSCRWVVGGRSADPTRDRPGNWDVYRIEPQLDAPRPPPLSPPPPPPQSAQQVLGLAKLHKKSKL